LFLPNQFLREFNMKNKTFLTLVFSLCLSMAAFAQTAVYTGTALFGDVPNPSGFFGDFYADHVASNSQWLMVGVAREDIDHDNDGIDPAQGDINAGAVYIYEHTGSGPVFHSKLTGEGNTLNPLGDRFGSGIALQGDIMFVAAANSDPNFSFSGQVYVYNYDAGSDAWVLVQKLESDSPNDSGAFGSRTNSSHIELFNFGKGQADPTIALIGEPENGTGEVAVLHVFQRMQNSDQWQRIQIAEAPGGLPFTNFADKVERAGKYALVTEYGYDFFADPDLVHVYRVTPDGIMKNGGELQPIQTLEAPAGPSADRFCFAGFGDGIDSAGDIAVISEPCSDTAASNAGAVHVYTIDNSGNNDPLTLAQTIPNPSGDAGSFFGSSLGGGKQNVTTDGNLIAVGTSNFSILLPPNPNAAPQQDVQLFVRDAGADTFSLADSVPSPGPGFPGLELYGQTVTLFGDTQLAIGQLSDPDGVSAKGHLFLFEIQ
jgi:hypothetical protein